jgi:hypothetical protein
MASAAKDSASTAGRRLIFSGFLRERGVLAVLAYLNG